MKGEIDYFVEEGFKMEWGDRGIDLGNPEGGGEDDNLG
jgi:hypothetical protein